MTDKMRDEFEAWMLHDEQGPKVHPVWLMYDANTNTYQLDKIQGRWVVWQASREALATNECKVIAQRLSEITGGAIGMPFEMAMESELSRRQFHSIAQALLADRDQLKEENEALRKYGEEFAVLAERRREEVETLRKGAERYQLLREGRSEHIEVVEWIGPHATGMTGEDLDALLGAAMGKGEQS